ncbi:MAG: hypothetical protein AAB909_00825 [Patescibacteria group bacterium]
MVRLTPYDVLVSIVEGIACDTQAEFLMGVGVGTAVVGVGEGVTTDMASKSVAEHDTHPEQLIVPGGLIEQNGLPEHLLGSVATSQ